MYVYILVYIDILTLLLGLGLFTNENADRDAKSFGSAVHTGTLYIVQRDHVTFDGAK